MADIEVQTASSEVEEQPRIVVQDNTVVTVVNDSKAKTAIIEPNSFVLSSNGMYDPSYPAGQIPKWLVNAIEQELTTGDGNITGVISDLALLVNTLEAGVNQAVTRVQNAELSLSALETSVVARLDENSAGIASLDVTKVDANSAQAIAASIVSSTFGGDVNAYIGNIASTYVDANSAIAQDVSMVVAELNSTNASVTEVSEAIVDTVDGPRAKNALTVDAGGNVSGYVAEADGTSSEFTIFADRFAVTNGTGAYTPFVIDGTNIKFNGLVEFSNVTGSEDILLTGDAAADINANTTTIDGGKITTGSLDANRLTTNYAWIGGSVQSSDFTNIGGPGFRLKANAAGTSADPTIYGAYIYGAMLGASLFDVSGLRVSTGGGRSAPLVINESAKYSIVTTSYVSISVCGTGLEGGNGYILGASYGSGYAPFRVASSTTKVNCTATLSGDLGNMVFNIEYSFDGGITWVVIETSNINYNYRTGVTMYASFTVPDNAYAVVRASKDVGGRLDYLSLNVQINNVS